MWLYYRDHAKRQVDQACKKSRIDKIQQASEKEV